MMTNKLKKYLLALLLLELCLAYGTAYAQVQTYDYSNSGVQAQIKSYLCTPTDPTPGQTGNPASRDLYTCINKLYKFAVVLASVIGVFFLVIAGYLYMSAAGEAEGVTKAKEIVVTTVTSFVILLGGYILLNTLNPDLIQFRSIQP